MKKIKKYLLLFVIPFLLPTIVNAGSIRFNEPTKTSDNTYEFTLTVENIRLNAIQGDIRITNGNITNVTMDSSWINKTGKNNQFYFYHNGSSTGNYTVATIEVTMTDNSEYSIHNLEYNLNKCKTDEYGNYFGELGSLVSKATYDATCSISKDATLKSLTPSSGTLSPKFDPSLELYNVTVENNISFIRWNTEVSSSKAKVISGNNCSLKVGITLCKIIVEAEAGNQKTYTVTVTRKNSSNNTLSTDASISSLKAHGGTLTKSFFPNTKEYDVKMDKNAKELYFTFTTNSNKQNYTSKPCIITSNTKTCKLTITAEDGVSKVSYLFTILQENNLNQDTTSNKNNSSSSSTNSSTSSNKNNNPPSSNTNNTNTNQNQNTTSNNGNNNVIEVNPIEENQTSNTNNPNEEVKTEEQFKEETNENNSEEKEVIKLPLVNTEIKKDTFFKAIAFFDLILGIGIGVFIAKHYKRKNKRKTKKKETSKK